VEGVRRHLERLSTLDRPLKVFGANLHRYRSQPASVVELDDLERALGVTLPAGYRRFLLSVGYGAGPYYGLWSPDQVLEDYDGLREEHEEEFGRPVRADLSFPLGWADAEAMAPRAGEPHAGWRDLTYPADGCVPICHQGCTFWSVLVTAGELAGTVWDVTCYAGFDGQWSPARRAPGLLVGKDEYRPLPPLPAPPTFMEWYDGWLERALFDLGS
jgi:hypothetical protein